MIRIPDLTPADVGRWVVYRERVQIGKIVSIGRIKGWNHHFVWVVYKCDGGKWDRYADFTGVPTEPEDLEFADWLLSLE